MSGAPSGWQTPKTNWQASDVPAPADFNRIEVNAQATELGNRALEPDLANPANTGTLRQILSWFAGRLKAITGAANWYSAPATTLAAAKTHMDAAAPHSGHETPAGAQAKADAAADAVQTDLDTHTGAPAPHSRHLDKGQDDQVVEQVRAFILGTDERSLVAVDWNNKDQPIELEYRDGATLVATIDINYNEDGRVTEVVVVAGNTTVTYTVTWDDLKFESITKVVS